MPTHQSITSAVGRSKDRELQSWVQNSDDYVVDEAKHVQIPGIRVWQVTPVEISHPMAFLVAQTDDLFTVTSGHANGVGRLMVGVPEAFTGVQGPQRVLDLLAPTPRAWTLVRDAAAVNGLSITEQASIDDHVLKQTAGSWTATLFYVDDIKRLRKLELSVGADGTTTKKTTTLAQNVDVPR